MKIFMYVYYNITIHLLYAGNIIEGPSNVTYVPGLTPLPIELTCIVTGGSPLWIVNGTSYTLSTLFSGGLQGHNATGSNISVNIPVNNTEYICVSSRLPPAMDIRSDPAYIIIAGKYVCTYDSFNHSHLYMKY